MPNSSFGATKSIASRQDLQTPLYHKVQLILRERIEFGYYGREGMLPSEFEISAEFGVSRITVARALNELAALGLVSRKRGAGTSITRPKMPPPVPASVDDLLENLTLMGKQTDVRVLEFGFVLPSDDVRTALDIGEQDPVQRAVRVRSFEGAPFSYLTSFVPGDLGKKFNEKDLATQSLLGLLEKSGVKATSLHQVFGAVLADPKVAEALDVSIATPLLHIVRTVYDRAERPIEYIRILYRPDRYQYRMTMKREKKQAAWSAVPPAPKDARKKR